MARDISKKPSLAYDQPRQFLLAIYMYLNMPHSSAYSQSTYIHPYATVDTILFLVTTYTYIQIDKFLHLQRNLSESPDKICTLGLLNTLGLHL